MEKLIKYTKLNFKPSKQYMYVKDIDKLVDEAQEWMLEMIDHFNFPSNELDLDLFRKEMTDWFLMINYNG